MFVSADPDPATNPDVDPDTEPGIDVDESFAPSRSLSGWLGAESESERFRDNPPELLRRVGVVESNGEFDLGVSDVGVSCTLSGRLRRGGGIGGGLGWWREWERDIRDVRWDGEVDPGVESKEEEDDVDVGVDLETLRVG